MNPTICTEICDDGLLVGVEICDDGFAHIDWVGCFNDCTGNWPGWDCSNIDAFTPTYCFEICGDGI